MESDPPNLPTGPSCEPRAGGPGPELRAGYRAAIRHPRRTLALALLVLAAALPGWARLELRVDGGALAPPGAPEVLEDRTVRERFGVRDPIAVVAFGGEGVELFQPDVLRWVQELTAALVAVEGVGPDQVTSLATEKSFRFRDDSLTFRGLLEPLPTSREALELLRDDLPRIGLYQGTLVSDDGMGTAIFVGTPPNIDRAAFLGRVLEVVAAHPLEDWRVDVLGAPVAETLLGHHVLGDLGVPTSLLGTAGVAAAVDAPDGLPHPGMVPVALLLTALVLLMAFRRPFLVLATLGLVGASLWVVFGVMGWLGLPIYLTLAVMPVLLTALGVADAIHLLLHLQRLKRPESARTGSGDGVLASRVESTVAELAPPVERTSWTTAVAFLSFALSPLEAVRVFGLCTAFGVLVLMVGALTLLPAVLCLVPPTWVESTAPRRGASGLAEAVARFGLAARRRPIAIGIVLALVALIAIDGVRRVRVHDSWLDGFAPDSAFARATGRFEERFYGAHRLLVEVRFETWRLETAVAAAAVGHSSVELRVPSPWPADLPRDADQLVGTWVRVVESPAAAARHGRSPRDWQSWIESARYSHRDGETRLQLTTPRFEGSPRFWLDPQAGEELGVELWNMPLQNPARLERFDELESLLAQRSEVGGVLGPVRYLETTAFMTAPDEPQARQLPPTPDEARALWRNYGVVRGEARLGRLVNPTYDRALITALLPASNFTDTRRLIDALRAFEQGRLQPVGAGLAFAGDVAVSQALITAVVRTQTRSLLLSLVGIFAVTALLFRSMRRGLICVVPSALVVWLDFALMGWLSIPLGVATSMFAGMTLGIGVDYAIHLLARFDRATASGHADPAMDALATAGPAIAINALAVGLGFGVLLLSQVPGNARLGFLLVASLLGCLIITLLGLPASWSENVDEGI